MGKTEYQGIDYGMGKVNIDLETGIRYGVISQHEVLQSWADSSEPYYGKPTCPKCGVEADNPEEFGESFTDYLTGGELPEGYTEEKYDESEFVCVNCQHFFGGESGYGDEPLSFDLDDGEYQATQGGDDSDIFILKSPYFTWCQFCSPCAPGAGYLMNHMGKGEGVRAYCFGHDWFDDRPTGKMVDCYRCQGKGTIPENDEWGHGGKQCWVCEGTGKRAEMVRRAPYPVYSVATGKRVKADRGRGKK